jgi:hypothetical protein
MNHLKKKLLYGNIHNIRRITRRHYAYVGKPTEDVMSEGYTKDHLKHPLLLAKTQDGQVLVANFTHSAATYKLNNHIVGFDTNGKPMYLTLYSAKKISIGEAECLITSSREVKSIDKRDLNDIVQESVKMLDKFTYDTFRNNFSETALQFSSSLKQD